MTASATDGLTDAQSARHRPRKFARGSHGYPSQDCVDILAREVVAVAKTLIDVDEQSLVAAQEALGTSTKKDTVNAALRAVTALAARRRDLRRLVSDGLPDLADDQVMAAAWQR
jgi:Arc/MetJ family transcription regulator